MSYIYDSMWLPPKAPRSSRNAHHCCQDKTSEAAASKGTFRLLAESQRTIPYDACHHHKRLLSTACRFIVHVEDPGTVFWLPHTPHVPPAPPVVAATRGYHHSACTPHEWSVPSAGEGVSRVGEGQMLHLGLGPETCTVRAATARVGQTLNFASINKVQGMHHSGCAPQEWSEPSAGEGLHDNNP